MHEAQDAFCCVDPLRFIRGMPFVQLTVEQGAIIVRHVQNTGPRAVPIEIEDRRQVLQPCAIGLKLRSPGFTGSKDAGRLPQFYWSRFCPAVPEPAARQPDRVQCLCIVEISDAPTAAELGLVDDRDASDSGTILLVSTSMR